MAEYINIRGQNVEVVASDPANPTVGQIWYNSTSNTLKGLSLTTAGAWATGGAMNNGRYELAFAGTQTAALGFGGYIPPASVLGWTEEYNGSTWTSVNPMGTARYEPRGCGVQTAAVGFGGLPSPGPSFPGTFDGVTATEEYDGTNWTTGGSLPAAKRNMASAGTQTAALSAGGIFQLTTYLTTTEEYDGSTWTSGGALPSGKFRAAGMGIQTAALAAGGSPGTLSTSEEYDGSTWTAGGTLNTARGGLRGAGLQTAGIIFGGSAPAVTGATETYDGTSFTTDTSMSTARTNLGSAGIQTSALAFGGSPGAKSETEEFTGAGAPLVKTITSS